VSRRTSIDVANAKPVCIRVALDADHPGDENISETGSQVFEIFNLQPAHR
jgi:hypothetical protein